VCGEHVQWFQQFIERPMPFNIDGTPHVCARNANLKIYSEEEKREFARRRLAGEI
jgi:hypothetical protein